MKLCRVIGSSVATVKEPVYEGLSVLVVHPLTPALEPTGAAFLAVDFAQAGEGDTVLVAQEGNAARQLVGDSMAPIHSVIMGVVDEVELESGDGVRVGDEVGEHRRPSRGGGS